jgi:hypothetical protein
MLNYLSPLLSCFKSFICIVVVQNLKFAHWKTFFKNMRLFVLIFCFILVIKELISFNSLPLFLLHISSLVISIHWFGFQSIFIIIIIIRVQFLCLLLFTKSTFIALIILFFDVFIVFEWIKKVIIQILATVIFVVFIVLFAVFVFSLEI